jgi:hypothetical protein
MAVRVTQESIETAVSPDNAAVRVTQEVIESLVVPNNQSVRVTQVVIEALSLPRPPGALGVNIDGTSTVTVVSLVGARRFGPVIHGTSSVSVHVQIIQRIMPLVEGTSTVSVRLEGVSAVINLIPTIAGHSTVAVTLSNITLGQFSWTGESSVFIRGTSLDLQLGQFSWTGESQLSIMPGFTPAGRSAEQAIHVAESDAGTWTATFGLQTTGALAWDITAAALQTALQGLSSIGAGNLLITGGPGASQPFLALFSGALANTPVGLISADGSGLSGPSGLNPHVGVISLSPGYSADDDYGTADDIQIKVTEVRAGVSKIWNFRGVQHNLHVTESDMAGDEAATFDVEFTPPYDLPLLNAHVIISDLRGPWWAGYLENPRYHLTANMISAQFSARGRFTALNDNPYAYKQVFVKNTNVKDIWTSARDTLTNGEISSNNDFIVPGKQIDEDTDLYNNTTAQLLDNYSALGGADDRPLTYGVRLPLNGPSEYPIMYVEPEAIGTTYQIYLADGAEVDVEYDSAEIITRHAVPWEIQNGSLTQAGIQIVNHTAGVDPNRLRTQVVGQTFPTPGDATNYGEMLGTRHGLYQVHGGSISIPGGVPVWKAGHVYPHWRIRPNQIFDVPDKPTEAEGLIGVTLRGTKFSWEQVSDAVSIACGRLNDLKRVFRQLVNTPDQREQQPNEPVDRNVTRTTDLSSPRLPWNGGIGSAGTGGGFDPHVPDRTSVALPDLPATVRTVVLMFTIPRNDTDTEALLEVDFDCIIRQVTMYAPLGQDGSASVVVGHSTYAAYGTISNLANLSMSGSPGKAREPNIAQQLLSGDVVYAALPTPIVGYSHIYVAVACERSW